MRKLIINGLVIAVLAGCSCGKWVDVGSFATGAGCKELEDMKKPANKEAMMFVARQTCSMSGSAWTGDIRCEKDAVQVKCK